MDDARAAPAPENEYLDGTWEQAGRSPNTAAILALIGIGALYFNAQSLLAVFAIVFTRFATDAPDATGPFFQQLRETIRYLADPLRAAVVVSQYLFMLLPAIALLRRWHSSKVLHYIRFRSSSVAEIGLSVLATVAIIPAANFIAEELVREFGVPRVLMEINAELFTARSPVEFVWLVFVVCLTPAICEEVFFRGFVQRTFERTMGWKSVVLIGVLFGLFHFNPLGLISLAILGVLFGYFYFRSKSLLPSMAAHFANNFIAVYLLYSGATSENSIAGAEIPGWFAAATLPIGVGFLFAYHRITRPPKP